MKSVFNIGDTKTFTRKVTQADVAAFETGEVHAVYATFALARDAEWACRLFVLDMKEADEEGIGTQIEVLHKSGAKFGDEVVFIATLQQIERNEVLCSYTASVGERVIATGTQTQKILKKDKLKALFANL